MAITIKDKDIDRELLLIVSDLKRFGINASKTDAIRWLLNIKRQGKKTHKQWGMRL